MRNELFETQILIDGDFHDFAIEYKVDGDSVTVYKIYDRTTKKQVKESFFFTLVDRSDIINDIMDQTSDRIWDDFLDDGW